MSGAEGAEAFQTVGWVGDPARGHLRLIDQTRLPTEFIEINCHDVPTVWEAIKLLRVRGAPAIGVAAAYGAVIGARSRGLADVDNVHQALRESTAHLRTSRPTAVNLFWALDRMDATAAAAAPGSTAPRHCSTGCSPRLMRSPRRTGPCAGPSASTGRTWWQPGRAS